MAGLLERNSSCRDGERPYFRDPAALEYFVDTDDCTAKPAGTRMRNPAYARTLARKGADAFYYGATARDIADAVQGDLNTGGDMTVEGLANYRVVAREPVCIDYRGDRVCGMGPPSSGALAVGQILGILENFDLAGCEPLDVEVVHLFTRAGRLAFADRNKYVADSDFITVPVVGMLDKDYLADRAAKLSGTSHVSIVARYGNALSMTTTIESSFGNGVMVRGILLNNELTDFSFAFDDGVPIANRLQPDKRPRSSMSPTIVFDEEGEVPW